jgi:hypothetical protein
MPSAHRHASGAALASGVLLLVTAASHADDVPSLDLRGFHPPEDPRSGLYLQPALSPDTLDFNAALWASHSFRPVTLRDPATGERALSVIEHQLGGNFVASVGLLRRFSLGLDLPFVAYQTGDAPTTEAAATLGDYDLPTAALGDLKLLAKVTLVPPTSGDLGGFALGFHERFGLPTGHTGSYLGEGAVQSESRLLVEYRLLAIAIYGATGVRLRAEREAYGCAAVPDPDADCATRFGHELPWGLGVAFWPQAIGIDDGGHWTWFLESYGYVPLSPVTPFTSAALSQAQLGAALRYTFENDVSLFAGVDAALVRGIGTAPVRTTLSIGWAPRKHDMDDDGVPDREDKCPEIPEDRDGFEDEDGCPDWDNDGDGVADANDQCEGEFEDEDGFQDDDGCPDLDNDGDGIPDLSDACPNVPGIPSGDPKRNGCPDPDPDRDGVEGAADKCPEVAEDRDGFQDEDGCPDPDNDGDGVPDVSDRCPNVAGPARADEDSGCPDADGDGIVDDKDRCPAEPGVASEDPAFHGCPPPPPPKRKGPAPKGRPPAPPAPAAKAAPPSGPAAPPKK